MPGGPRSTVATVPGLKAPGPARDAPLAHPEQPGFVTWPAKTRCATTWLGVSAQSLQTSPASRETLTFLYSVCGVCAVCAPLRRCQYPTLYVCSRVVEVVGLVEVLRVVRVPVFEVQLLEVELSAHGDCSNGDKLKLWMLAHWKGRGATEMS